MSSFAFVRHGHIEPGSPGDVGLSAVGRRQASVAGEWLASGAYELVVSSPLRRARETAELMAEHLDLEVVGDERLRERMNWGDIPGQSFDDFVALWQRGDDDRDWSPADRFPSTRAAGERLAAVLCEQALSGFERVVLVGHGGTLEALIRNLVEDGTHDVWLDAPPIAHCSITELWCDGSTVEVGAIGNTVHLALA